MRPCEAIKLTAGSPIRRCLDNAPLKAFGLDTSISAYAVCVLNFYSQSCDQQLSQLPILNSGRKSTMNFSVSATLDKADLEYK